MVILNDGQDRHDRDNQAKNKIHGDEEDVQTARGVRGVEDVEKNNSNNGHDVECSREEDQTTVMFLASVFTFANPIFIPTRTRQGDVSTATFFCRARRTCGQNPPEESTESE